MSRRLIAIGIVLLLSSTKVGSISGFEAPPLLYTATAEYKALAWMTGGDRFPKSAKLFIRDGQGDRELVNYFAASADPTLSFDATRVLFAGKQTPREHWQIWEVHLAGGAPRQVSSCRDDCVRPLYLPGDRLTFAEKVNGVFVIVVAPLAGGTATPVTYSPGNHLPTDILRDGRILFETAHAVGKGFVSELYTVYTDGSGVEAYRCDHGSSRHSGKQLASGDIVFAQGYALARFTSSVAHEVRLAVPAAEYAGDVVETSNGDWLVASRTSPNTNFAIFRWTPAAASRRALITGRETSVVQPTLISERPIPNRHPSGLHDWDYANLLCLNAYTSKSRLEARSIASVRLYARGTSGAEKALGEAPVEKDGSFYLRSPADQPLKIELLDTQGRTIKKEAGWFWLRRGEQRVCVGCHAGPETAPENAVPQVLLRSTLPADMTTSSRLAAGGH